jgi:hypothetical protein
MFGKTFSHIFKFLASITTSTKTASPALVEKIITLCDQLIEKINEAWGLERKTEDQRDVSHNQFKTLLQKSLNQYNSQIANLDAEVESLSARL